MKSVQDCGIASTNTTNSKATKSQINQLAVDTETYYEGSHKGLKSIQVYGDVDDKPFNKYILPSSFKLNDHLIRIDVARQFFDLLESMKRDTRVAFFNIDFDASQFLYYMTNTAGYNIRHIGEESRFANKKGDLCILESDRNMYSITFRTKTLGKLIWMVDIANFLPGSSLNSACLGWIGDSKVEIDSKEFRKRAPTELEKKYAMKDAELTYNLFKELQSAGVIEGQRYVTIAGRTMAHFKEHLMNNYGLTFDEYFYKSNDKEYVNECKQVIEVRGRKSTRGGMCMAVHTGTFHHCTHVDARSMYPTQGHKPYIPVGELLESKPGGKCTYLVYPRGYFEVKDEKLPYFQWRTKAQCARYEYKDLYEPGNYVSNCMLDGSYAMWEDEWKLVKKNYEIDDLDESKKVYFQMEKNTALKTYFEEVYQGKQTNTGSKKLFYKYLLNSLYGKFLSNPDGVSIDYIDGRRIKVEEHDRNTYYLPVGMWIAMGGRVDLFNAMNSIDSADVLYCDTDSIIFKGNKMPKIKIGDYMGDWSIEAEDIDAYIVGPKTYQERFPDGKLITKCAGMPRDIIAQQTWQSIYEGLIIPCRKPRRDPLTWAINFEETEYTISTRASIFRGRGI